jgi:glycosidase
VLDVTLTEREPHRSLLAMYTELIRLRREHPILTDPEAQQHVSFVDDTMSVVRSLPGTTAAMVFNFSPEAIDHPSPDPDAVVFDSDDERWQGPGWSADRLAPWSARLSISDAS